MVTASPTSRPPASRAAFQVRPKSFRLIRVDGGPNFGFGDVIFITFQDAGDRSEFSQHIRDHHVLDLELGRGMNAIDNPGAGGSFRLNQYGAHFHSPLIRIVV